MESKSGKIANSRYNLSEQTRIEWIDFAKGVSILFVIIGHTVGGILRGAIFSFHMPLFFILSCVTYKYSTSGDSLIKKTEHAFKHLIVPAFVMYCLRIVIWSVKNYAMFMNMYFIKNFIKEKILIVIFSSGVNVNILSAEIPAIGIPWFLVVLFLGRSFFDYLNLKFNRKKLLIACIFFSVLGVLFGKVQWLPLSFDIALAILPFFLIGKEFNRFHVENKPLVKFFISMIVWTIMLLISYMLMHNYMELSCRRYTLYPLCYLTATAGTLMISEFSVIVCKWTKRFNPFLYLGKHSLYMLCIHMLDSSLLQSIWKIADNLYINTFCRIVIDLIVFAIFMFILEKAKKHKKQYI